MKQPKLKNDAYSPTEVRVFNVLAAAATPLTSEQMIPKVYRGTDRPYHAKIIVNAATRDLAQKMDRNREPYKVKRTKRKGARMIETALVRR